MKRKREGKPPDNNQKCNCLTSPRVAVAQLSLRLFPTTIGQNSSDLEDPLCVLPSHRLIAHPSSRICLILPPSLFLWHCLHLPAAFFFYQSVTSKARWADIYRIELHGHKETPLAPLRRARMRILYFNIPSTVLFPLRCLSVRRQYRWGSMVSAQCERLLTQHLSWTCEMPCTCESLGVMQSHTRRKHTAGWAALNPSVRLKSGRRRLSVAPTGIWPSSFPVRLSSKLAGVFTGGYTRFGGGQTQEGRGGDLGKIRPDEEQQSKKSKDSVKLSDLNTFPMLHPKKNYPNFFNFSEGNL